MTKKAREYAKGDWIVHSYHGVGQVKAVERKTIAGARAHYYRVKASDRVFWVPVEESEHCSIRPLVSQTELKKALRILRKPPKAMEKDYRARQRHIKEVKSKGTLQAICRLVRDLSARRKQKSLNDNEEKTLDFYREILLKEWSLSADVPLEDAHQSLQRYLKEGFAEPS